MLFMVIERFRPGRAPEVYRRFRDRGRLAPEGLHYVSSWVDLVDFEIVPVRTSAEAAAAMAQEP